MTMTNRWLKKDQEIERKINHKILTKTNVYPFQSCFSIPVIFKNLKHKSNSMIFKQKHKLHSMLYFKSHEEKKIQ